MRVHKKYTVYMKFKRHPQLSESRDCKPKPHFQRLEKGGARYQRKGETVGVADYTPVFEIHSTSSVYVVYGMQYNCCMNFIPIAINALRDKTK